MTMIRTLESQVLAMPAPMRCLLVQQAITRRHLSSTTTTLLSSQPSPDPPPPAPLSFLPSPSNNPNRQPIPSPAIPPTLLETTTALLTTPPPRFLYSAPRFLNIPINTRVPEICLLGRSNVGKSTLINALSGISSSSAGRSHGSSVSSARKHSGPGSNARGLAITSSKAGCTRTMNGYAFGLPTPQQKGEEKKKKTTDLGKEMMKTPTRSARRLLASRLRDTTPDAALVLMDMPGYGLNSRAEWGEEISKYLRRRKLLRGAVLLVDAVAGIKDGDRMVLRLLRDANVRTLVVLTKADKLGYGHGDRGTAQVARMCETVWDQLRDLERGTLTWTEGKGWEAEIWVTGAGDPRSGGGGVGVEGARFAIARLAGLVQDGRDVTAGAAAAAAAGLAPVGQQRIVPFEELEWASSRVEV